MSGQLDSSRGLAMTQGPRVRIGIVNLMPHAAAYERMLLPQLAATSVEPVWIRMQGRSYHLDHSVDLMRRYVPFHAADVDSLAGLIVTGAAVEHLPFEEVRYMSELSDLVKSTASRGVPVFGLCWGALAVGHILLGLSHAIYQTKVSGVYKACRTSDRGLVAAGLDDEFWIPNSRFAGFDQSRISAREAAGAVEVVARSDEAGVIMAQSPDLQVLLHIGHPEYSATRLVDEYRRDQGLGLCPSPPCNVRLDSPVNLWRSHSLSLFANWARHVGNRLPLPALTGPRLEAAAGAVTL